MHRVSSAGFRGDIQSESHGLMWRFVFWGCSHVRLGGQPPTSAHGLHAQEAAVSHLVWRSGVSVLVIDNIRETTVFCWNSLLPCGVGLGPWDDQLPSSSLIPGFCETMPIPPVQSFTLLPFVLETSFQAAGAASLGRATSRNSIYSMSPIRNSRKVSWSFSSEDLEFDTTFLSLALLGLRQRWGLGEG